MIEITTKVPKHAFTIIIFRFLLKQIELFYISDQKIVLSVGNETILLVSYMVS